MSGLFRAAVMAAALCMTLAPGEARAQFFDFPSKDKKAETKPDAAVIAVFELRGTVSERPAAADPIFGDPHAESLQSLVTRIDAAAADDKIKAAVLLAEGASFGPGQREEFRAALQRFQEAGKPIHAHADSVSTESYALLCGATNLSVTPTGDVWVTGIYGEGLYVRGLLDLIGVQPDFLTCGDYKSAAETFTRTGPSAEAEEMQTWLYDGLYSALVDSIAAGRKVEADKVRGWIDQGLFSAEAAKAAGLIDAVEHRSAF
ncbi:MAG: S49 family peptidase, partial [Planctomycetaceae bacterium]|nr:S49 family peptidase [Planctomycetaceae bacterium]